MIDFNNLPCKYWSDRTKISYLQRRIIVYSIMYYELNESCISDQQYDELSRQLMDLQSNCDFEEFRNSTYYYVMYNFDGSTGFDIPSRLTDYDYKYLLNIANHVYQIYLKETGRNKEEKKKKGTKNVRTKKSRKQSL